MLSKRGGERTNRRLFSSIPCPILGSGMRLKRKKKNQQNLFLLFLGFISSFLILLYVGGCRERKILDILYDIWVALFWVYNKVRGSKNKFHSPWLQPGYRRNKRILESMMSTYHRLGLWLCLVIIPECRCSSCFCWKNELKLTGFITDLLIECLLND